MKSVLISLLCVFSLAACPKNEESCTTNTDCGATQVCEDGTCRDSDTCTGDPDCTGGYTCVENRCVDLDAADMSEDTNEPDATTEDMSNRDMGQDTIPPTVVSIDPPDGATDVPLTPTVTIELSEPPQPTTINFQSIVIRDPANQDVATTVTHDPGTTTITLVPDAPLLPATGYRIIVTENVRDMGFNPIEETITSFVTLYNEPAEITALAERYAPVVYQALASDSPGVRNLDLPTRVDFDGNLVSAGNLATGEAAAIQTKAAVYYHVVRTETHDYISYILYYLGRIVNGEKFEHDFTGVTFVIERATGNFKIAEGVKVQVTGMDTIIGFKPSDSDTDGIAQPQNFYTFDAATFEGDRYPLYIPHTEHEACNFFREGPTIPFVCRHQVGEFPDDDNTLGLVMRPAPGEGQRISEATTLGNGRRELTYELVPLMTTLWAQRSLTGPNDVWQSTMLYQPVGDRPGSIDVGPVVLVPTSLSSDTLTTYGVSPFRWLPTPGQTNAGQWFIDPASILPSRYSFQETFSDVYCFNPIVGIDRSGEAPCAN